MYAVYAAGVVVSLMLVGHVSDWYGRRTVLVPALFTALVGALVFASSSSLPALLIGRVLTGLALGAAVATATAYLTDLDSGAAGAPTRRSQIVATVANVGGLAVGPLLAGLLAQYLAVSPRMTHVLFAVLLALVLAVTTSVPEGRPLPRPRRRYQPQRFAVPAAARAQFMAALTGDFLVFTVFGVFAGLASAFLTGTLHRTSPALAGLAVFISFGVGALTQVTTMTWPLRRLLAMGIPVLVAGLRCCGVRRLGGPAEPEPVPRRGCAGGRRQRSDLQEHSDGGYLDRASDDRAGALALFFVVGYVGLSLPVIGAGIALACELPGRPARIRRGGRGGHPGRVAASVAADRGRDES